MREESKESVAGQGQVNAGEQAIGESRQAGCNPTPSVPPMNLPEEPPGFPGEIRGLEAMGAFGNWTLSLKALRYLLVCRSLLAQQEGRLQGLRKVVQTETSFIRALVNGQGRPLQDAHLDTIANNLDAAVTETEAAERGREVK